MTQTTDRDMERTQLETLLFARTYLYTMFHKLFGGEPSSELLNMLQDDVTADCIDEYAQDSAQMAGFASFIAGLRSQDQAALFDAAKDEYTRVFIGPAALPASPYEAPYTGHHEMAVFQENTIKVRRLYKEHGLQAKRLQRVPDDHVSLLCAFQALQARAALDAFYAGNWTEATELLREQGAFAKEHLANWLGVYAKAVRNSKAGRMAVLYPQLIEAADAFVQLDVTLAWEAAYWAEQGSADACPFEPCEVLKPASEALDLLEAQRLVGLEDNELVSI